MPAPGHTSPPGAHPPSRGGSRTCRSRAPTQVPLGVLQTPPEAGGIRFTPPLPHRKLDALGRLGFGLLNKAAPPRPLPPPCPRGDTRPLAPQVALWFDAPFWGRHSDFFGRTVA